MITIQNYDSQIAKLDTHSLPETLKDGHEFLLESREFYHEDKDIKETLDLYLDKLNEYLDFKKENKQPIIRDFYAQLTQTERVNLGRGKLSTAKQALADKLNLTMEEIMAFDLGLKPGRKTKGNPESAKSKPGPIQKVAKASGNNVEALREEVKLIKRFIGFHDREKEFASVLAFIKSLQRAIVQKLIRKDSPYAEDIRTIQERMVNLFNGQKGEGMVRISINDADLARYVGIVGGESVYKSIAIIKRFISLQGRPMAKEKIQAFIKSVKNAKLDSEDPYLAKVQLIVDHLKKIGEGKVLVRQQELNGLKGILKACNHNGVGRIYDTAGKELRKCNSKKYSDANKGACSHHHGVSKPKSKPLNGIMTAEEVSKMVYQKLGFSGKWKDLLGEPAVNFDMMVFGQPGSGKTTLLLSFAHYLATNFGSVIYVSAEEYDSEPLTKKINDLPSIPSNLHFAKDIGGVPFNNYGFAFLDSVTDLGVDLLAYKKLREKYPDTAFVLILQTTKDGKFKGGKEWEHEVEIAGEVDNGKIAIYKNRYGVKGALDFFKG